MDQVVLGSLQYFATQTRYDIAYEVNRVAQTLAAPTKGSILALKRIMAYLAGTVNKQLRVPRVKGTTWSIYSDSDHAGDRKINATRSVTGVRYYATECLFTGKVESSLSLQ